MNTFVESVNEGLFNPSGPCNECFPTTFMATRGLQYRVHCTVHINHGLLSHVRVTNVRAEVWYLGYTPHYFTRESDISVLYDSGEARNIVDGQNPREAVVDLVEGRIIHDVYLVDRYDEGFDTWLSEIFGFSESSH